MTEARRQLDPGRMARGGALPAIVTDLMPLIAASGARQLAIGLAAPRAR
jgi:hypothetical protein